jgi:phage host-nuclease inhibitor protein Gam
MDTLQEPTLKEVFVVDSEAKVNWLLSLLANLDAEAARIKAQTETRLKQIANEKQGLLYQYEADLKAFAEQEIAKSRGKRKSVVLMQGTLAFRNVPASLKVTDEDAALEWARVNLHHNAIRTVETLDKEAYKRLQDMEFQLTGSLLPGMERTPETVAFSIKFPKGDKDNGTTAD